MKCWLGKALDGKPSFSEYTGQDFRQWLKDNPGKSFRIEPLKKPVSENLRGYYFGPVLNRVKGTCDEWKHLTNSQLHQIMKKQYNSFDSFNVVTKRIERFGDSVMSDDEWNNSEKAINFLEPIRDYLISCGLDMPNSEEYKNARDTEVAKRQDYQKPNYHYPEATGEVQF